LHYYLVSFMHNCTYLWIFVNMRQSPLSN